MTIPGFYEPENIGRVRLGQIVLVVIAIAVSGYLAAGTVTSMHEVWNARRVLRDAKKESAGLSRQASQERSGELRKARLGFGGLDSFAVTFSQWAGPRNVRVESYTPEGNPARTEIVSGTIKLGIWNAHKVRVKGQGDFYQLMALLKKFESTLTPVRLESYALQSSQDSPSADVQFDFLLTVYEKASQPEQANAAG